MSDSRSSPPTSPQTGRDTGNEGWGWTRGRIIGVILTIAIAGFWIWAFSPLPKRGNPDRMTDRAFPAAAEVVCARALADIDSLPGANTVTSFADRADLVDEGTVIVREMIAELRSMRVAVPEEAIWIKAWLDDYDTYVINRDAYAARLRSGDDDAPEFTVRGAEGVDTLITGFAKVNDMRSCATPRDV